MTRWLLMLGAGASAVCPTHLPTFDRLSRAILSTLGWEPPSAQDPAADPTADTGEARAWRRSRPPDYPPILLRGLTAPPEVVFGTLHRFGVPFAEPVEELMASRPPNAVHQVAARLLHAGSPVWTPNVDTAVEASYGMLFGAPVHRVWQARAGAPDEGLLGATASTLVKFHGTCDVPGSLAFTDVELLTPPDARQAEHLASLAEGCRLVLYGYAGADADLQPLLRTCMERATDVTWFEPNVASRETIRNRFPGVPIVFKPDLERDAAPDFLATAVAFLAFARQDGIEVPADLAPTACTEDCYDFEALPVPHGPEIVNARLVQRFGEPAGAHDALVMARRCDLRGLRWRSFPGHLRWAVSESLYGGGLVARAVTAYARHDFLLRAPGLGPVRDRVLDRVTALLLAQGDWPELLRLTDYGLKARRTAAGRPLPSDLYYRAHALRYSLRVDEAIAVTRMAEEGLRGDEGVPADPERLAGAILERGILDLYQGRFLDALDRAADLTETRGRYAIQRWAGWGHWLAGFAHAYVWALDLAEQEFERAAAVFVTDPGSRGLADVDIGRLLVHRLRMARGERRPLPGAMGEPLHARPRIHDDLELLGAELALADGDLDDADRRLVGIVRSPSSPVAAAWAELGLAEIERRRGRGRPGFDRVRQRAVADGARWLEIQALIGMTMTGELSVEDFDDDLRRRPVQLREAATLATLSCGHPRVLWMVS